MKVKQNKRNSIYVSLSGNSKASNRLSRQNSVICSIPLLPELCLLCFYPRFKSTSKALNKKLANSAVLPVRRGITMGDKMEQGHLSMGVNLSAALQA